MPAYISIDMDRKVPTCGKNDCEQMEHFARVEIGPAIIEPFQELLLCMIEAHESSMSRNYGDETLLDADMKNHRREEPKCSYCRAIREGEKTLKAIKGRVL